MGSFIDMTGWKMWEHGVPESKLTVIRQAQDRIQSNGIHIKRWVVECNCEKHTIFEVDGRSIKSGNTTSCGCTRGYNKYDLTMDVRTISGIQTVGHILNRRRIEYGETLY